ncbi:transmembrane protein 53 isoform X1 [Arapaima gigas]
MQHLTCTVPCPKGDPGDKAQGAARPLRLGPSARPQKVFGLKKWAKIGAPGNEKLGSEQNTDRAGGCRPLLVHRYTRTVKYGQHVQPQEPLCAIQEHPATWPQLYFFSREDNIIPHEHVEQMRSTYIDVWWSLGTA